MWPGVISSTILISYMISIIRGSMKMTRENNNQLLKTKEKPHRFRVSWGRMKWFLLFCKSATKTRSTWFLSSRIWLNQQKDSTTPWRGILTPNQPTLKPCSLMKARLFTILTTKEDLINQPQRILLIIMPFKKSRRTQMNSKLIRFKRASLMRTMWWSES